MLIELKVAKERKKERKINSDDRTIWNDLCKSTIYPNIFPDSTCICFSHLQHRKSRIQLSGFSSRVFKIYMKPATFFCQAMNLVQSEPKLTIQISKASFVVIPATVELNRAVQSLLEHCPPPTGCFLVTINVEGTCVIGVDCIDTAVPFTSFVKALWGSTPSPPLAPACTSEG